MTANKRVARRSLKSDLARVDAHVIKAKEYVELPKLTLNMLARATIKKSGRPVSEKPKKAHHNSPSRGCNCTVEIYRTWLADAYGGSAE